MIRSLIDDLTRSSPRWERGRNLATLKVEPPQRDAAIRLVAQAIVDGRANRPDTAALLLLVGSIIFGERARPPFGWRVIADELGVDEGFHTTLYDAMERGAERYFGIPILYSAGRRRFVGTMLRHCGATRSTLERAVEVASRRSAWDLLRSGEENATAWLKSTLHSYHFRASDRAALSTDESQLSIASRLHSLAEFRERHLRECADVEACEQTLGLTTLCDAVEDEDPQYVRRVVAALVGAPTDDDQNDDVIEWLWRDGSLLLRFPASISVGAPPTTDRVRLRVGDAKPVVYARTGSNFVHVHGDRVVPAPPEHEVVVRKEARTPAGITEDVFRALPHPGSPVAVFDANSGRLDTRGKASIVALVPRPDSVLTHVDGTKVSAPVERPRGTPLELRLREREEETPWLLQPVGGHLPCALSGGEIEGLRIGGHPAFAWAPTLCNDVEDHHVDAALITPDGAEVELAIPPMGRVQVPSNSPGRYRLRVDGAPHHASRQFSFWYLPGVRVVLEDDTLEIVGLDASFDGTEHHTTLEGGHGPVTVPFTWNEHRGTVRVSRWREAAWFDGVRDALLEAQELAALTRSGSLELCGVPKTTATITFAPPGGPVSAQWSLAFTALGRARLSLAEVPSRALKGTVDVEVTWPASGHTVTLGRFRDRAADRPARADGFSIRSPRRLEAPSLRAVAAWRPWDPIEVLPVESIESESGIEYRAHGAPGPWIVALFDGDQRISGCWLSDPTGDPPADLGGLELKLWRNSATLDDFRQHEPPNRRAFIAALSERVYTFGPRFLRWSDFLPDIASDEWLRALVEDDPLPSVRAAFEALEVPPYAVRIADLAAVPRRLDDLTDLFIRLAAHPSGLAAAAFRLWGDHLDIQRCGPFLSRARHDPHDEQLASQPDEIPSNHPVSTRLAGLIEGHALTRRPDWHQLVSAYGAKSHRRIDVLDEMVRDACSQIARWQRGERKQLPATPTLYRHVPHLFDYWLNTIHADAP